MWPNQTQVENQDPNTLAKIEVETSISNETLVNMGITLALSGLVIALAIGLSRRLS